MLYHFHFSHTSCPFFFSFFPPQVILNLNLPTYSSTYLGLQPYIIVPNSFS
jgi:hypothetical protein